MEWHNKPQSLSHMGLMTIRLKEKRGDKALYKNTLLLAPCCRYRRHIGAGSHCYHLPFVLQEKKKKTSARLADYHLLISASLGQQSLRFFLFFLSKNFFSKAAMPLFHSMHHWICRDTAPLCSPCLVFHKFLHQTLLKCRLYN